MKTTIVQTFCFPQIATIFESFAVRQISKIERENLQIWYSQLKNPATLLTIHPPQLLLSRSYTKIDGGGGCTALFHVIEHIHSMDIPKHLKHLILFRQIFEFQFFRPWGNIMFPQVRPPSLSRPNCATSTNNLPQSSCKCYGLDRFELEEFGDHWPSIPSMFWSTSFLLTTSLNSGISRWLHTLIYLFLTNLLVSDALTF